MLRFLDVRHLAVIDRLEVELEPGLNVLTGETGAGKSILIAAIDLLLGGRASADLVRTGEDTATIQAVFEGSDGREVIVRRELSAQGRSRAFIDDTLATTAALRELGARFVDLHGQHEHQALLDTQQHIHYLDSFLDADAIKQSVGEAFAQWRVAAGALERSQLDDREKRARIEMAEFQLHDIEQVNPVDGEDDALEAERTILQNVDRLSRLSTEAYAALYDGDNAALASLAVVWKRVGDLAVVDPRFLPFLEGRDAVRSALDELAFFLRDYAADLEASPDRLQVVEDRLAALTRVKRKYGPELAAVLARRQSLRDELAFLGASEARIAELETEAAASRRRFESLAADLSDRRRRAAAELAMALERALSELAMPGARVAIRVDQATSIDQWSVLGVDRVEFHLSPNPGEDLRPLARIASGGELSRIMLALHALAAVGEPGRTLVFDEVDAGIGGVAADAVGARLRQLAARDQVLCITHLPQVAARADAHFAVTKSVRQGRTATALVRLDSDGREMEIARMIAGAEVTDAVRASARELLSTRRATGESETNSKGESRGRAWDPLESTCRHASLSIL